MDRVAFQRVLNELAKLFEGSRARLNAEQLAMFLTDKFRMRMNELTRRASGDTLGTTLSESDLEDIDSDFDDLDSDEMLERVLFATATEARERIGYEERLRGRACSEETRKRIILEVKKEIEGE